MVAPGVPQIHDYNPGVAPSGLFWTIRIPDSAVRVDGGAMSASYRISDVTLFDYPNVEVALLGVPATQAVASFDSTWRATGAPFRFRDTANKFSGVYRMAKSTIEWKAVGPSFSFQSDPARTSFTTFSAIGREGNGIFFK